MVKSSSQRDAYRSILCWILSGNLYRIRKLEINELDWERLVDLAIVEGVGPLIYFTLDREDVLRELPPEVRKRLQVSYIQSLAKSEIFSRELERLSEACQIAEVPILVIKGGAFNKELYSDPGLRPMNDIDILIRQERYDDACRTLRGLGYEIFAEKPVSCHTVFRGGPASGVTIELHWNLAFYYSTKTELFIDWLWNTAEPLPGVPRSNLEWLVYCYRPSLLANLFICLSHLLFQPLGLESRLLWLYDLHLIILKLGKSGLDEALLLAKDFNLVESLQLTCAVVGFCFNPSLFTDTQKHIDEIPEQNRIQVPYGPSLLSKAKQSWSQSNWRERLGLISATLFPSKQYMRWIYAPKSERFLWLCYPRRWFYVLKLLFFTPKEY